MADNHCKSSHIDYKDTGYFSRIATHYIDQSEDLKPLYQHSISVKGIEDSINARKFFPEQNRSVLVKELQKVYATVPHCTLVAENIQALKKENTYTITTAHQPNILGGPLYLVYKILHVVKISQELNTKYPDKHFVPVYYMGSEDADLDELNNINIYNQTYTWHTNQTGAVGRMFVDDELINVIDEVYGRIGVEKYGEEWTNILRAAYTKGKQIQQATFEFINTIFGKYGLIIIIPDNAALKRLFEPVVIKEIEEQFSHKAVLESISELTNVGYKVQTSGRELNLFYLIDDKRERIERENEKFLVKALDLSFSKDEIINELKSYPERFSGNVVLRGPFQETILPNIIFVGGGGELAYWLEMKKVYKALELPYPMLLLRNSYLLYNKTEGEIIHKLGLNIKNLFQEEYKILDKKIESNNKKISLQEELNNLQSIYQKLKQKAYTVDATLSNHVEAMHITAKKKIERLEKKIASAQRKQLIKEANQITKLKQKLFPNNSLQERNENIAGFYAIYGSVIFDKLLENALTFESKFTALET